MGQGVKCLLHKNEVLTLNPHKPHKARCSTALVGPVSSQKFTGQLGWPKSSKNIHCLSEGKDWDL